LRHLHSFPTRRSSDLLNSAETNEEIQRIAQEVSPMLSEFRNDLILNEKLFQRIKAVYEKRENLNLSEEQSRLLEKKYKSFSRNRSEEHTSELQSRENL